MILELSDETMDALQKGLLERDYNIICDQLEELEEDLLDVVLAEDYSNAVRVKKALEIIMNWYGIEE